MGDVREELNRLAERTDSIVGMSATDAVVLREVSRRLRALSARAAVPEGYQIQRIDRETKLAGRIHGMQVMAPADGEGLHPICFLDANAHAAAISLIDAMLAAAPQPAGEASPVIVGWMHEDELPESYPYDAMFPHSRVDFVRMFPVYAPPEPAPSAPADVEALAKAVLDARSHIGPCRPDDPDDAQHWDRLTEAARCISCQAVVKDCLTTACVEVLQALVTDWRTRHPADCPTTERIGMREYCADQLEALVRRLSAQQAAKDGAE